MKLLQLQTVTVDLLLPNLFVDGSGDPFDESGLEEEFQDLNNFLEQVFLFGLGHVGLFPLGVGRISLLPVHVL